MVYKIIHPGTEYSFGTLQQFNSEVPDARGGMAYKLIERWGMVAAIPDGEDSAGRSRLRLLTPEEMVDRAFKATELFWNEAHKRGMVCEMSEEEVEQIKIKPKKGKE